MVKELNAREVPTMAKQPLGTDTWLQGAVQQPQLTSELADMLKSTLGGDYDVTGGQVASSENEKVVLISEAERRQRFGIECKGPFGKRGVDEGARGAHASIYETRGQ